MYCDANGRPNPDGDYQMVDGKVLVRQGRRVHFDISMFRDGAGASSIFLTDGSTHLTDAQITAFRDSPQGREFLAYVRSERALQPNAGTLTADEELAALQTHLGRRAPQVQDADIAAARTREEAAYRAQDPNAWRRA